MPFLIKITMTVLQQRNCFLSTHVWELTIGKIGEFGHIGKETQSKEARIALSHGSMFKSVLVASFEFCYMHESLRVLKIIVLISHYVWKFLEIQYC